MVLIGWEFLDLSVLLSNSGRLDEKYEVRRQREKLMGSPDCWANLSRGLRPQGGLVDFGLQRIQENLAVSPRSPLQSPCSSQQIPFKIVHHLQLNIFFCSSV